MDCAHSEIKCKTILYQKGGFPDSSVGKESACNAGDPSSIPGLGRSAGEGIGYPLQYSWASLLAQQVKNPPAMWKTWVQSLHWEDPWRRERLPTPVFWPGERVSGKESDTPERRSLSVSEDGVSVGGCSAQGCRMTWRLEGAAVWAHRPRRPPAHRPAPSGSPLHPRRCPTSGRCLETTSFLSSLPFSRPRGRGRPDLSLCLVRLDSGPASRPLGTTGRIGSDSERQGLWWAWPLRNLAHPQGPSRRAVDEGWPALDAGLLPA